MPVRITPHPTRFRGLDANVDRAEERRLHGLRQADGDRVSLTAGALHIGLCSGLTVDPSHLLPGFVLNPRHRGKALPHWTAMSAAPYPLVSDEVRTLIEACEPGVHQFVPIAARYADGEAAALSYNVMNIRSIIDCIDPVASDLVRKDGVSGTSFYVRGAHSRKVLARGAIQGRQLWRDEMFGDVYVSDELAGRLAPLIAPSFMCEAIEVIG